MTIDINERLNLLAARLSDDGAYVDSDICVFAVDEIKRLRKMVKDAYNDGFCEGMREMSGSKGGIPWSDSKWRRELGEKE